MTSRGTLCSSHASLCKQWCLPKGLLDGASRLAGERMLGIQVQLRCNSSSIKKRQDWQLGTACACRGNPRERRELRLATGCSNST